VNGKSQVPALVIGMGINTNNRVDALPEALRAGVASLSGEIGTQVDNSALMETCLRHLTAGLELLRSGGWRLSRRLS